MRAFSKREWRAIREALAARLAAGEIDVEDDDTTPNRIDYERALRKVNERIAS